MLLVMLLNCKHLTKSLYIAMVANVRLNLQFYHCMHMNCYYTVVYSFVL
jgi:hypothetical protein